MCYANVLDICECVLDNLVRSTLIAGVGNVGGRFYNVGKYKATYASL